MGILMQCGFAFLEAGSVRSKNTVNILIKNLLDCLIGGVAYWAIGWAVAYGDTGNYFIGTSNFFSYNLDHSKYPSWFFPFVFAATAATIVSGSIAERCHFTAYFAYSITITAWVYPPVTHWAWDSSGWLAQLAYKDYAGSGVVHVLGGVCALTACALIGPRRGRFTKQGIVIDMPGHSVPLAGLGGFLLLFGFLAFNGGSQLAISNEGDAEAVGLVIVNTIIGGCGGGLMALFNSRCFSSEHKWSYLTTLNGALAGMVAQCAGCNLFEPWTALIVGLLAGVVFILVHNLMLKLRLDDPLDAVAVHAGGGSLGVICVPFFMQGTGIFWVGHITAPWYTLGINLAGLVSIALWAFFWSGLLFGT
jgi:Amt family ammonium transporter